MANFFFTGSAFINLDLVESATLLGSPPAFDAETGELTFSVNFAILLTFAATVSSDVLEDQLVNRAWELSGPAAINLWRLLHSPSGNKLWA